MRTATPRFWACSATLATAILALLFAAQGSAQGPASSSAEEGLAHVAAGRQAQNENRIQDALSEFAHPSVAQSPLWECGAYWQADLLVKAGKRNEAKPLYLKLFEALPHPSYRVAAAAFLAGDAEGASDNAAAVTYVRTLVEASPDDPAPRARLAGLLESLHLDSEARIQALWLWTKAPSSTAGAAFFKTRPQWAKTFSTLSNIEQLERLRTLARGGDLRTLAVEWPRFQPRTPDETGWAKYLQGRLLEGRGQAAEAIKVFRSITTPEEARLAAIARLGSALPNAGMREPDREAGEALVASLPASFEGRQRALVGLLKWRIAQPNAPRARVLAEALLAGGVAQPDACEYLFSAAWKKWLAADHREAEALWRSLATRLPTESDYRHASGYALYRLGRMTPQEQDRFREITLKEDRYGYFGYRMRGSLPPAVGTLQARPREPAGIIGSHVKKAKLLLSVDLASDAVREFQLALADERDAANREPILWAQSLAQAAAEDFAGAILTARVLYPRVFNENGDALPETTWRVLYPAPFQDAVIKSAEDASLPYILACSVIRQESLWDPHALSRSGAHGLMQLMPSTAAELARKYGFSFTPPSCYDDPAWNTRAGCTYLRQLLNRYHGRLDLALAAYNAGPGRVDSWLARPNCPKDADLFMESIPFKETRSYVRRILLNCWEYSRLYPDYPSALAPGDMELASRAD